MYSFNLIYDLNLKITVLVFFVANCRYPQYDITDLLRKLERRVIDFNNSKKTYFCCGDLNINLLETTNKKVKLDGNVL